jgi:hypothetical protein
MALGAIEGAGQLATLEKCRLVAVDPATTSAVLAIADADLQVVHTGDAAPAACGPFRVVEILADRLVLEPSTPAASGSGVRQAWLPLSAAGASAAPQWVRRDPPPNLQVPTQLTPGVIEGAAQAAKGNRQVRAERPSP